MSEITLAGTGIVIPYSCSAWIASIHQGIDVARAAKLDHIAACTGSTSEEMVRKLYDMPLSSIIDMGDFVGGTLKYLRRHPVPRLTIAGGFGKLSKLAAGHMDLHSKRSQVDPAHLAGLASEIGAADSIVEDIRNCTTANQILLLAGKQLADAVAGSARDCALAEVRDAVDVEVIICDRQGHIVGRAS